jgi:hypothetical protein
VVDVVVVVVVVVVVNVAYAIDDWRMMRMMMGLPLLLMMIENDGPSLALKEGSVKTHVQQAGWLSRYCHCRKRGTSLVVTYLVRLVQVLTVVTADLFGLLCLFLPWSVNVGIGQMVDYSLRMVPAPH